MSIGPPGAQGPVGVAPGAHSAWGQLRWAVNRTMPQALRRSGAYRRHALRTLRRAGR
jgi:hypothetical protein